MPRQHVLGCESLQLKKKKKKEISVFLFPSITPSSLIERSLASDFGFPLSEIFIHSWDSSWTFSSLDYAVLTLLLFFVVKDVPVPQSSLWFLVSLAPGCPYIFYWRGQNWTQNSDGASPAVRGRITPLHLLSVLLLSDHRVLLAFFITSAPRLLVFNLLPIENTRAFSELSNWLQHVLVHWVIPW